LRAGVVRYLESLPDLEASAALSGITGELLTEQDTGHNRRLRTQVVVSSALRRGEKPLPILTGLLNRNEPTSIDDALLAQLWRNQDSTVTDAYQVLKLASPAGLGGALSWLDRALSRPPGTPEEFRQYTSVCQQLMDSPLRTRLAEARMPTAGERGGTRYRVLGDIAYVYAVSSSASTVGDLADVIDSMAGGSPSVPAQALATTLIAPKAATLPATATPQATRLLLQMLRLMPAPAVECYLESLQHRIGRGDRDLPAHVAAIWLFARTTPESGQHGGWITRLLGIAARDWPSSQQARAGKLIDTIDWDQASRFATWIDEHRVGLLRRMVRGAFATIREVGHRPREAREATALGRGRLALPPKPFETDNR
jgi:hypothetical protein